MVHTERHYELKKLIERMISNKDFPVFDTENPCWKIVTSISEVRNENELRENYKDWWDK